MMSRLALKVLTVAALTATVATCAEEDARWWPQFRGPDGRGIAAEGEYPLEFSPDKNLVWKTSLPSGVSSPCIWNEHVYLTAHDPERGVLETICLNRGTGEVIWRRDAPAKRIEKVHEVSSPANATPACDGERVFVYFESYGLIAFDHEGNTVWSKPLPLMQTRFGSGTSPIVADGLVILNRDGRRSVLGFLSSNHASPQLLAFDAKTGEIVWETNRPGSAVKYATPVIWRRDADDQVLVMSSNRLTSYDLASGREVWWVGNLPPQACAHRRSVVRRYTLPPRECSASQKPLSSCHRLRTSSKSMIRIRTVSLASTKSRTTWW